CLHVGMLGRRQFELRVKLMWCRGGPEFSRLRFHAAILVYEWPEEVEGARWHSGSGQAPTPYNLITGIGYAFGKGRAPDHAAMLRPCGCRGRSCRDCRPGR